jgi:hypothetical protein
MVTLIFRMRQQWTHEACLLCRMRPGPIPAGATLNHFSDFGNNGRNSLDLLTRQVLHDPGSKAAQQPNGQLIRGCFYFWEKAPLMRIRPPRVPEFTNRGTGKKNYTRVLLPGEIAGNKLSTCEVFKSQLYPHHRVWVMAPRSIQSVNRAKFGRAEHSCPGGTVRRGNDSCFGGAAKGSATSADQHDVVGQLSADCFEHNCRPRDGNTAFAYPNGAIRR